MCGEKKSRFVDSGLGVWSDEHVTSFLSGSGLNNLLTQSSEYYTYKYVCSRDHLGNLKQLSHQTLT